MSIYESSRDHADGSVLMLWDGDRPSDDKFTEYARQRYGVDGKLGHVSEPVVFRGLRNPGTAIVFLEVEQ